MYNILMNTMVDRGITPTVYSYNILMIRYSKNKKIGKAIMIIITKPTNSKVTGGTRNWQCSQLPHVRIPCDY